jgi:hypothetical protein
MRPLVRNLLILIFPFATMVMVNEYSRLQLEETDYLSRGQATLNPPSLNPEKCTWACHNDTGYCKTHHVKFDTDYFAYTDPLYFGMITVLKGFGNYGLANILFLVLFFPILIYLLLIKSLHIQDQLNKLRKP